MNANKLPKGPKPAYRLRALNKASNLKGTIGSAWNVDEGAISIQLDSFVTLHQDGNLVLTLFPVDGDKGGAS